MMYIDRSLHRMYYRAHQMHAARSIYSAGVIGLESIIVVLRATVHARLVEVPIAGYYL